jgi:hypothetical protein
VQASARILLAQFGRGLLQNVMWPMVLDCIVLRAAQAQRPAHAMASAGASALGARCALNAGGTAVQDDGHRH